MTGTTIGVKVDEALRVRLKAAAAAEGRGPHGLVKQAILSALEHLEAGGTLPAAAAGPMAPGITEEASDRSAPQPFLEFARG